MILSRLSVDGYGARRAGSFAGRAEVIVVVVDAVTPSGGIPSRGGWEHTYAARILTKKELKKRFGITEEEAEVVTDLAQDQAQQLKLKKEEKERQLSKRLEERQKRLEVKHLEALTEQYDRIINLELAKLLKLTQIEAENEEFLNVVLLVAAA